MATVPAPGDVLELAMTMQRHDHDALRAKHAHAGMAMAAATFAMAITSGVQAALYLHSYGVGGRTDGFFVAFALYTVCGVFSQSLRVTSAPLLVDGSRGLSVREFAAALALIAVPVAVATMPLAHPLSQLMAPGLSDSDRSITESALPILGGAMILQLFAAGAATVLAVRDHFNRVALAYIVGSAAGLGCYLTVADAAGELSMGWSALAMTAVTCALMLSGLGSGEPRGRAPGGPRADEPRGAAPARTLRPARLVAETASILGRTAIYLAFNGLYLITLAFTSGFEPGEATVLSYAYMFAAYLVAGTAFALGMSRIADMRRGALADWRAVLADTVPHGFRYSMLLVAPAMAVLVTAGAPLVGEVFSASLTAHDVSTLRLFGALLAAWTLAALLANLLLPAMFALGRARLVNALALPLVALHAAATGVGGILFGSAGVVGAMFVAPFCFATVLLAMGAGDARGHLARELARDGLRFAGLAAVSYGAGAVLAATVAGGAAEALLAGAAGTILYVALAPAAAPQQVRLVIRSLRPASA